MIHFVRTFSIHACVKVRLPIRDTRHATRDLRHATKISGLFTELRQRE